jgi:hypothetical protein
MGYFAGMLKYIAKGPFTNPVAFFIYGSGLLALWNGYTSAYEGIVPATIAYFTTKYLPPTTPEDVIVPILIGSAIAGIKWYLLTPRN